MNSCILTDHTGAPLFDAFGDPLNDGTCAPVITLIGQMILPTVTAIGTLAATAARAVVAATTGIGVLPRRQATVTLPMATGEAQEP